MTQTFKNTLFTKRDPEQSNIVACVLEDQSLVFDAPETHFEPCKDSILAGLEHLYTHRGVKYYGYL